MNYFVLGNVNTSYTRHITTSSALSLFVAGIALADDAHDPVSADDFALAAALADGCLDFHDTRSVWIISFCAPGSCPAS